MYTTIFVMVFLRFLTLTTAENIPEDAKLLVPQLIRKYGYACEVHRVVTTDGYILTLHRIPPKTGSSKGPVVLQHGIIQSSADFIISGPEKALGYILADAGYDVWLANSRGNTYSRSHTRLTPNDKEFWNFSWHEMGVYDATATVDYILAQTSKSNLYFVGYSQGTTVFYVMCSERPEYNRKIKLHISLAPTAYMNHITSPIMLMLAQFSISLDLLVPFIGEFELLPSSMFMALIGSLFCSDGTLTQPICTNLLFAIAGFDEQQMNATLLPAITGHTPAGTSVKQFMHYAQLIRSGKFQRFDKGFIQNFISYGSFEPPNYRVENIVAPVYIYKGRNDWMSNEIDVNRLRNRLPNVKSEVWIAFPKFNHIDYVYAINASALVYNLILSVFGENP
ncbi:hypothetical protein FQR65_LT15129 [Abscondita terminalis]|nr:hypothetical protein FQR65_LT15129 [Abscondita terminalis]